MPGLESGGGGPGWERVEALDSEGIELEPDPTIEADPNSAEAWERAVTAETGPTFDAPPTEIDRSSPLDGYERRTEHPERTGEVARGADNLTPWSEPVSDPVDWDGEVVIIDHSSAGAGPEDSITDTNEWAGSDAWDDTDAQPIEVEPSDDEIGTVGDIGHRTHSDLAEHRAGEPIWAEAAPPTVSQEGRHFEHPDVWIADVNDHGSHEPGRAMNCVDSSRAVEARWRGQDATAAPLAEGQGHGASGDLVTEWAGGSFEQSNYAEIEQRLTDEGHGASAIVGANRRNGVGHLFNAVNHEGSVLWIDGQAGVSGEWPPPDYGNVKSTQAVYFP